MTKSQKRAADVCNANLVGQGMFESDLNDDESGLVKRVIGQPVISESGVSWWPRATVERAISVLSR